MDLIIECYPPSLTWYYCYLFSLRKRQCCSRSGSWLSCPVVNFFRCAIPSTRIHAFLVPWPRRKNSRFYTAAFPFSAIVFHRVTSLAAGPARGWNQAGHLFRSRTRTAAPTHGIDRSVFDDELTPIEAVILWMYQSSRRVLRTREIDKCEPGVSPSEYEHSGG